MSHIKYTICRSGSYYYNRRVPKHAVQYYGQFIRYALSTDIHETKAYAERLSDVLESSWSGSFYWVSIFAIKASSLALNISTLALNLAFSFLSAAKRSLVPMSRRLIF